MTEGFDNYNIRTFYLHSKPPIDWNLFIDLFIGLDTFSRRGIPEKRYRVYWCSRVLLVAAALASNAPSLISQASEP